MSPERKRALYQRFDHLSETPMLVLSIVFLFVLVIPYAFDLSNDVQDAFNVASTSIWIAFAIELLVKVYLSEQRIHYLVTHWIDVVIVVFPFLRPLRVLRAFAIFGRAWTGLRKMLRQQTAGVIGLAAVFAVVLCALLVFAAESKSDGPIQNLRDALWWGVVTVTTVGYGDMYPVTGAGRIVGTFLMITGVGLFSLMAARIAAYFVGDDANSDSRKLDRILTRLDDLETQNRELHAQLTQLAPTPPGSKE